MKATYRSTCSLCGLAIQEGEDIDRKAGVEYGRWTYVKRSWAHARCIEAWKDKSPLTCDECGDTVSFALFVPHMTAVHGRGRTSARHAFRDKLYERVEARS